MVRTSEMVPPGIRLNAFRQSTIPQKQFILIFYHKFCWGNLAGLPINIAELLMHYDCERLVTFVSLKNAQGKHCSDKYLS